MVLARTPSGLLATPNAASSSGTSAAGSSIGGSSRNITLAELVDGVVRLGGVFEALQSLRKHLPAQVRVYKG